LDSIFLSFEEMASLFTDPIVVSSAVVAGVALTVFLSGKKTPKNQILSGAVKLFEFLEHNPHIRIDSKEKFIELLKKYRIVELEDLLRLFKEKEKSQQFFTDVKPLVYSKFHKKLDELVNSIILLLPQEEKDNANDVSLNLMGQLDGAVEHVAPVSPKIHSSNVVPTTPVPSSTTVPSSMVSSGSMVSPVIASPSVDSLYAQVVHLTALLEEKKVVQQNPPPPPPSEMDVFEKRLLKALKAQRDQDAAVRAKDMENVKGMFKAKEAEAAAFGEEMAAKMAAKDEQIRILTAKAENAGKHIVDECDDVCGDGEEDEENDEDDEVSVLTNGSKGGLKKKTTSKSKILDDLANWNKSIEDSLCGFYTPEIMAQKLQSSKGLRGKMPDGSVWSAKVLDYGSKSKAPSMEVSKVASPISDKKSPSSSYTFSTVMFTSATGLQKFVGELILAVIQTPGLSAVEIGASVKGLIDYQAFWSLRFIQVVGPSGMIQGNPNQTQFSDSVLVACAAWGALQSALFSEKGLASLKSISSDTWSKAIAYTGANNNKIPHDSASYMQAAAFLLLQCPRCFTQGMAEPICWHCDVYPAGSNLVPKPSIPTSEFTAFMKKNNGMSKSEQEEKFKTENKNKSPYADNSKSAKKPDVEKFRTYLCTHQGAIKPPSSWA